MATLFALTCCGASVVILVHRLGRRCLTSIGALFIFAAVIFHGVSELVNLINPGHNSYRQIVTQEAIDRWLIWIGPVILIVTLTYVVLVGAAQRQPPAVGEPAVEQALRFFDWRYCLLVTAPLYFLALTGHSGAVGGYFAGGLTNQYLLLAVPLTTFAYVARHRRPLVAVGVQSVALVLLGQRLAVVSGLVLVAYLLARHGVQPTRRELRWAVLLVLLGSAVLSSARATVGRADLAATAAAGQRPSALLAGVDGLFTARGLGQLANDYVYRIDGNAFPATVLDRQHQGYGEVGLTTVNNDLALAVPSFLNPAKNHGDIDQRSEKLFLGDHYEISTATVDYLPTIVGTTVAYFGPAPMLLLAVLIGAALAFIDRGLRRVTPVRTVMGMGALLVVLYYERDVSVIPVTMRGALTLAGAVWALHLVRRTTRQIVPVRPIGTRGSLRYPR